MIDHSHDTSWIVKNNVMGHNPKLVQNKTKAGWDDDWNGIESYGFIMDKKADNAS